MIRIPVFLLLAALLWPQWGRAELKTPPTIRDSGIHTPKDFAGEWVAYWLRGSKLVAKTQTEFVLSGLGEWRIRENGKTRIAGSFRAADNGLLFTLLKEEPPAGAESAPELPELLAHLIDRDSFLLRSEAQPDVGVVYRRKSAIVKVRPENVEGEWRMVEEDIEKKTRRQAPFSLVFDRNFNYQVKLYDPSYPVPPGAERGTYTLEDDEILLKNDCADPASAWSQLRFFMVFDTLTWNTPNGLVYGEKK